MPDLQGWLTPSLYREGDYLLPHNDHDGERALAAVLHLPRDFSADSGGQLVWCRPLTPIAPERNSLTLFNLDVRSSTHYVNRLAPPLGSGGARYALSGWFSSLSLEGRRNRRAWWARSHRRLPPKPPLFM